MHRESRAPSQPGLPSPGLGPAPQISFVWTYFRPPMPKISTTTKVRPAGSAKPGMAWHRCRSTTLCDRPSTVACNFPAGGILLTGLVGPPHTAHRLAVGARPQWEEPAARWPWRVCGRPDLNSLLGTDRLSGAAERPVDRVEPVGTTPVRRGLIKGRGGKFVKVTLNPSRTPLESFSLVMRGANLTDCPTAQQTTWNARLGARGLKGL